MNEKLLSQFAKRKDNNVVFTGIGDYFQGDPCEKALFEVLIIQNPKSLDKVNGLLRDW